MLDDRSVVIPGDVICDDPTMAGSGTYVDNGIVHASIYGLVNFGKSRVSIIPHKGKYYPSIDDKVIGIVKEVQRQRWNIDINCPYDGSLHISQYPKRIDLNEMDKYMAVGDTILARVTDVDAMYNIELTMNDKGLKVLQNGRIISICPTKMSRVIGRAGSMIRTIKNETGCGMFVGQNGMIWINGSEDSMDLAARTIKYIEENAHTSGLTDKVVAFLKVVKGNGETEIDENGNISEESEDAEIVDDISSEAEAFEDVDDTEDVEEIEGTEDIEDDISEYTEFVDDTFSDIDADMLEDVEGTEYSEDVDDNEYIEDMDTESTPPQDEENEEKI